MADERRTGDLILVRGEYALVQDGSSGEVHAIVGPSQSSIGETDSPIIADLRGGKFVPACRARGPFAMRREGSSQ